MYLQKRVQEIEMEILELERKRSLLLAKRKDLENAQKECIAYVRKLEEQKREHEKNTRLSVLLSALICFLIIVFLFALIFPIFSHRVLNFRGPHPS
jgi:hypothetical protein